MKPAGGHQTPIIGIAGWKKSGKTTLVTRLIAEFTARGLKVATVKHAHHDFQIDEGETDSARHRRAGASQVAVVSSKRWALINELDGASEPDAGRGCCLARSLRPYHRGGLQGGADPQDRAAPQRRRIAGGACRHTPQCSRDRSRLQHRWRASAGLFPRRHHRNCRFHCRNRRCSGAQACPIGLYLPARPAPRARVSPSRA